MKSSLVAAIIFLGALSGCSPDRDAAPQAAPDLAGAGGGRASKASCSGEATTRFEGKLKAVRLRITPCRVESGEAPKAVLINTGEGRLGYGFPFKLERRTGSGWRWVNRRQAFVLPLFYLGPGEHSEPQSLAVNFAKLEPIKLRPGLYRVSKGVDLTPGRPRPPTMAVRATFTVE